MKKHSPEEGAREDLDDARGEWFARQLGERWQPAGDGIYRYVDDLPDAPAGSEPPDRDDLVDALDPSRHEEPPARDAPPHEPSAQKST
jgi:hypothetical protein